MQVTTSTTGYEEEAEGAATGHEEAQATAIDQQKKLESQALVWCLHRETEAEAPEGR